MKSLEMCLLGLYTALIEDVRRYYPRDIIEWKRDESRLRSVLEARGSKFVTIDLVAIGKHFDRCLSNDTFIPSGLPYQKVRKKGSVIPRLFGGLLIKVFKEDGSLRENVEITAVSLLRELYYASKKVRNDCDPSATFKVVKEFFDTEKEIRHPTCNWDDDDLSVPGSSNLHLGDATGTGCYRTTQEQQFDLFPEARAAIDGSFSTELDVCQRVADLLSCDLGELPWSSVLSKHGPGAVSDQKKGKSKYAFPNWPLKLELEFPAVGFAISSESLWPDVLERGYPGLNRSEPPSKLIVVPKTQKAPRLIASEPTAHQWMQQGVRAVLLKQLDNTILKNTIHFREQEFSQRGALRASAQGTGCTIDLSSASDRLSCWVVERIFRKNSSLIRFLHSTRTRWLINEVDKKQPKFSKLRKFAPMGSALTFPVQSIVYAIVSIACIMMGRKSAKELCALKTTPFRSLMGKASRNAIVFGDDIIVPEHTYPLVSKVLSYLGLKVNSDKTFVGGKFYESCGVDAYAGVDVTPTYYLQHPVESDPSSVVSAVCSSNNFHEGGLWATAAWLVDQVPKKLRNFIGVDRFEDGPFGLKSFAGRFNTSLKETWNENAQRWEPIRLFVTTTSKRIPDEGIGSLLQYYTEDPGPLTKWVSGIPSRESLRFRIGPVSTETGKGVPYCDLQQYGARFRPSIGEPRSLGKESEKLEPPRGSSPMDFFIWLRYQSIRQSIG